MLTRHPQRTFLLLSSILLVALYGHTLTAPFVYDDLEQILRNPDLASWHTFAPRYLLHPIVLTGSFLGRAGSTWRPLSWLSLFLDRRLFGPHPAGFHATSLLLHLLCANLLFTLLRQLPYPSSVIQQQPTPTAAKPPRAPKRRHKTSLDPANLLPTIAALLWLALPVNTEAVAWISARAYPLVTALILTSLLALLAHLRRPSPFTLTIAVLAATLAPLAHELGLLTLPLAVLLTPHLPSIRRNRLPLALIAFADAAILLLRQHLAVHPTSGPNPPLLALQSLGEYLALTLFPLRLSVERSTTLAPTQLHPALLLTALAFLAITAATLYLRLRPSPAAPQLGAPHLPQEMWGRRKAPLQTGLLWFLLAIAPLCLLANYQGIAERFAYLASAGLTLALTAAALTPTRPQLRRATVAALAVFAAASSIRTAIRAADWTDPVRLYRASLLANPDSPTLHYNLAFSLRQAGDLPAALHEYQTTLTLDRTHPHAYASLGDTYLDLHQYIAAQAAYRQALRQTPDDPAILLNVATAYAESGDPAAAEATYRRVLTLDPRSSAVHTDLGVLLQQQNRPTEAMHQFAEAIDLKATDPTPFYNLAVLFQTAGRPDLAIPLYRKVLELRPNDPETLRNLAQLHPTP